MAGPAIPLLAGALGWFFAKAAVGIVARVLSALGLGVVTYAGVTFVLNQAVAQLHSEIGGVPSDVAQLMGLAGIDVFLSLVISARFGVISFWAAHKGWSRLTFLKEA